MTDTFICAFIYKFISSLHQILLGWNCHLHFTDEYGSTKRLSNLPELTQLGNGLSSLQTGILAPESALFSSRYAVIL